MLSNTVSTAGKNSTTSKSTIRFTSYHGYSLRQQAKVNTPNTAKLKQALKVAAVIYLHLSLS